MSDADVSGFHEPPHAEPESPMESGREMESRDAGGEDHPLGTLFVLMVFLIVLAGMWGAIYLLYLNR